MTSDRTAALRLIIAYKAAKSVLQIGVALVLFHGATHGLAASLTGLADGMRAHAAHAWSEAAAAVLLRLVGRPHGLLLAGIALAGDGLLSGLEAWALARGYRWGPWLVVAATSSLLPFELAALHRHVHAGRVVLLAINVAIVVYLVRRARREHRRPNGDPTGRARS